VAVLQEIFVIAKQYVNHKQILLIELFNSLNYFLTYKRKSASVVGTYL